MGLKLSINIKNFRILENVTVEIRPITLLFGTNSSGKSTFLSALLFLKHTYDKIGQEVDFNIEDFKSAGIRNYKDIVYNNDVNRKVIIKLNIAEYVEENFDEYPQNKNVDYSVEYEYAYYNNTCVLETVKIFDNISKSFVSNNEEPVFFNNNSNYDFFKLFFPLNFSKKPIIENDITDDFIVNFPFDFKSFLKSEYLTEIINSIKANNTEFLDYLNNYGFGFYNKYNYRNNFKDLTSFLDYSLDRISNIINDAESYYKDIINLYYKFNKTIPHIIEEIIKFVHIPKTRLPIKERYRIFSNKIELSEDKEYYSLLNHLFDDQGTCFAYNDNLINENSNQFIIEKIQRELFLFSFYENNILIEELESLKKLLRNNIDFDNANELNKIKKLIKNKKEFLILNAIIDKFKINDLKLLFDNFNYFKKVVNYESFELFLNMFRVTNYFLRLVGLGKKIVSIKKDDFISIYTVNNKGDFINAENESSGFLQLLPIIIGLSKILKKLFLKVEFDSCNFVPLKEQTNGILIEQPELHLHPKLQANLADIIYMTLEVLENPYMRKNLLIVIETHSEHLLRKFQIHIAKGKLNSESIAINFFNNINSSITVNRLKTEENGLLSEPMPNEFFDDSYLLGLELIYSNKN